MKNESLPVPHLTDHQLVEIKSIGTLKEVGIGQLGVGLGAQGMGMG